ncbi:MAG: hypothetical protein CBD18_07340 [Opitutales bacterium TMED158]|nr:MAG: hypothetical protein CBD18_07340 [Opitutales bacterium TMED158]
MFARVRSKPEFFVPKTYPSIDAAETVREVALDRFFDDYRKRYPSGKYVAAELPELPFEDGSFDVALCGHLLFLYSSQFDYAFFKAAIRELLRVARNEIRIHPIVDSSGQPYGRLDDLRSELRREGFDSEIIDVPHEFFRGISRTLAICSNSE